MEGGDFDKEFIPCDQQYDEKEESKIGFFPNFADTHREQQYTKEDKKNAQVT